MHLKRSFAVIGGDLRQRCLLRQLRGLGFPASAYRVPDAEDSAPDLSGCLRGANVLILPMPAGGGVPAGGHSGRGRAGARSSAAGCLTRRRRSCRRAGSHFMTMRRTRRCCCKTRS